MTFKLPIAAVGNVSSDIAIDQKSAVIEQVEFVYPMDVVGSGSFQGTGVRTIPIGTISVTVRGDSATGYIYGKICWIFGCRYAINHDSIRQWEN